MAPEIKPGASHMLGKYSIADPHPSPTGTCGSAVLWTPRSQAEGLVVIQGLLFPGQKHKKPRTTAQQSTFCLFLLLPVACAVDMAEPTAKREKEIPPQMVKGRDEYF